MSPYTLFLFTNSSVWTWLTTIAIQCNRIRVCFYIKNIYIIEQYSPFRFRTGCCTVHGGGTFVWATAKRKRTRPLDSHRLKWKEKEFLRCQGIPYFFKCFRRSLVEGGGACERVARRRTVGMLGAHPNSGDGRKQHKHNGNQQR